MKLGSVAPGVYRMSEAGAGVQAEGLHDGVQNLFGKVKQGVVCMGLQ